MQNDAISVLCVDDNELIADALQLKLQMAGGFTWLGWLPDADRLVTEAERNSPDVLLLDIDMPGRDPFIALEELSNRCPETRVIIYSGYVRKELIDRAVEAGAWGYVGKNEEPEVLLEAIRSVCNGQFTMGPEVEAEYAR